MFLLQRIRNAIVTSRIVGPKLVTCALVTIAVLALAELLAGPLRAQDQDSKKLLGQRLVDEVAAKHKPDLIYLGLHGKTPKSKNSVIFASTDSGKIGKKSSCADLHVVEKGIPVMEMKGKSTTVLERLLDSSGHTVGLIVVGFNYSDGQESEAAKLAKQVGEELAQQIPTKNKLFEAGK
jgi:RNase H-fold protein (predicted Holliday junction resolvase)